MLMATEWNKQHCLRALMNKNCPKCNTENPLQAKYCRHCGNKFDEKPVIADFKPTPSDSVLKRKKWTLAIGILALAMLLVVHFYDNDILYYFKFGYSKWQNMKHVIKSTCYIAILFSIVSIIYAKIKNRK